MNSTSILLLEPPMIPSKRRHTWEDKPQKEVVDSRLITHDESDDDNFPAIPELEVYFYVINCYNIWFLDRTCLISIFNIS